VAAAGGRESGACDFREIVSEDPTPIFTTETQGQAENPPKWLSFLSVSVPPW
jgi:hypothetical protein